jgi:hypothetical protein
VQLFGIDAVKVQTRLEANGMMAGVPADVRQHLESVWHTVVRGYNSAIGWPDVDQLERELHADGAVPFTHLGWAYEGAALALTVLDKLLPTRRRLRALLESSGTAHGGPIYIGVGWGLSQLRRLPRRPPAEFDPVAGWMIYDGAGFREALFKPERVFADARKPASLSGAAARVFDHGVGRLLWFREGGGDERIRASIEALPGSRHADLWAGVGLGATYAGGVGVDELTRLRGAAQNHAERLAESAAIAAWGRRSGSNAAPWTERACQVLCGVSPAEAADAAGVALDELIGDGHDERYLAWRARIGELLPTTGATFDPREGGDDEDGHDPG